MSERQIWQQAVLLDAVRRGYTVTTIEPSQAKAIALFERVKRLLARAR